MMTLKEHIDTHYNGNVTAFARANCTTYMQVKRWIRMGCSTDGVSVTKVVATLSSEAMNVYKCRIDSNDMDHFNEALKKAHHE